MAAAAETTVENRLELPADYRESAGAVRRLHQALRRLEERAAPWNAAGLEGRDWYEALTRKLLPQLGEQPYLVVAVVGGTNIGKSVVFNHLAGERASASSPLASGTKHPVCLVSPFFLDAWGGEEGRTPLDAVFPGFALEPWSDDARALEASDEDKLFWRVSPQTPRNLLILDTPDIDSDAPVNWVRADRIRHCADVLIAVLTQQKYNDAAVKQFFRQAAREEKAVIVVFNQCLLPEDHAYWPLWLKTFLSETGLEPEFVYVAPNDRAAAEQLRLPFYEQAWPPGEDGAGQRGGRNDAAPRSLAEDLSRLHFTEIKLRALRASLRQLVDRESGVPAWLEEIRARSQSFRTAAELLTSRQLAHVARWPQAPQGLVVQEIRSWWRQQREGWIRRVHDAYNVVGEGLLWPFRMVHSALSGPARDPLQVYRELERDVMLGALEELFGRLTELAELGDTLLKPRLQNLLKGEKRAAVLRELTAAHDRVDLAAELKSVVRAELEGFRTDRPQLFQLLNRLDAVAAAVRPATSVALFFVAGGPLGHAVAPMLQDAVVQAAGGTGAVLAGETVFAATGKAVRNVESWFRQLHARFTLRRARWFADLIQQHLLGDLEQELSAAAGVATSDEFQAVVTALQELTARLARAGTVSVGGRRDERSAS